MEYLNAFLCGGILCAVGQIIIDKTQLTPARILTGYVVVGVLLSALGLYEPLAQWGGAGATGPLTGRGHTAAVYSAPSKSVRERRMFWIISILLFCHCGVLFILRRTQCPAGGTADGRAQHSRRGR